VRPVSGDSFTEEQEVWLGDAMADLIEHEYQVVKDPALNAYLDKIANRLLAVLPPTKIRFRFVLIDSSAVNGFSLAGGRVYVTRKLVTSAQNEDEIAGVLAHEIGHIVTHQSAAEISDEMKRLMGVTSFTDKADVYDKFRRLMDAERNDKKRHHESDSDAEQNVADRVAVYAMSAAGYAPAAYSEFWDRSFFVQGKTGGALSDFFGMTTPSQKRLRQIRLLVAELTKGCGAMERSATAEFHRWQAAVTANQHATAVETADTGIKASALEPALRMDLQRLRFSPDGKYLMAQDESSIFVLQREPLKFLFRFDAENAYPAQWNPDSTKIVFHTPKLHVEEWSVAQQKLQSAHELVVKDSCLQTVLSPDGRTLACVSAGELDAHYATVFLNLSLVDVETGQVVLLNKDFFDASAYSLWIWALRREAGFANDPLCSAISQDGSYLVLGAGPKKIAVDWRTRMLVKLGGEFAHQSSDRFVFDEQGIVGEDWSKPKEAGVFSFPDGRRLSKATLSFDVLRGVSKGNTVYVRGGEHNNIFVVNMETQTARELTTVQMLDAWGSSIAVETPDGSVGLVTYKDGEPVRVVAKQALPLSPLSRLRVIELSPDGRYLAVSGRSRGAIWDLKTGQRLYHVHGFNGATFTADGNLYVDFAKHDKTDRMVERVNLNKTEMVKMDYALNDSMGMTAGRMVEWKDQGKKTFLMTVRDPATGKEQWNRTFEKSRPAWTRSFADNNLLFIWRTSSSGGKAELKNRPELASQVAALKDKDAGVLVEVVSIDKGEVVKAVVLEHLDTFDSDGVDQVQDTVLMNTEDNRVLLFSAKTGAMMQQVFGYVVGVDRQAGLFCVKNRRDEALVYDLQGKEVAHFEPGTPVRFARFEDGGRKLLLLGADQKIRVMDLQQKTTVAAK
jgi:WD40 repeat protein